MGYKNKISGLYCILNKITNKSYIGKSVNCNKRINDHKSSLIKNKHHSRHLQHSFNKYGIDSFEFYILCEFNDMKDSDLYKIEMYFISLFDTKNVDCGYNMDDGGKGSMGLKHTEESKIKISNIQKGKTLSEDTKRKMSESHKGYTPKNFYMLDKIKEESKISILQYDIYGNFIKEYTGINECAKENNILATNLVKTLKGKNKTCGCYLWFYKDGFCNDILLDRKSKITEKMISRYNKYGKFH